MNKQFKEFKTMIEERDKELEDVSMELALGLSETFEVLNKIASGDPKVRMPEVSENELLAKLKQTVNKTAEEIGTIVDQSHEFAIGLAEHFDILHRVSKGDLNARISEISQDELLKALGRVTNQMIENVSREITERKQAEEALRVLSLVDDLTGLRNRRGFFTLAEQQIKIANRLKKGMFLLFTDLDGLKWINDNLGHNEGDLALVEVANILKETFRESDIIARIGGDEFVVLMIEPSDGAQAITNRLQEKLKAYNTRVIRPYKLSLSTGISLYNPEYPCSIDELLARADASMYEQKRSKRNFSQKEVNSK